MYTYFAASLPLLEFDGPLPLTLAEFAAACERLLPARDAREARLALGMESGAPASRFLARWREYDRALRVEAARARAARLRLKPPADIWERAHDGRINAAVARAAAMDDPLEAERLLVRLQWDIAGELALGGALALDGILAYAVRLKLLERLAAFKSEDGAKELKALLETAVHSQHGI